MLKLTKLQGVQIFRYIQKTFFCIFASIYTMRVGLDIFCILGKIVCVQATKSVKNYGLHVLIKPLMKKRNWNTFCNNYSDCEARDITMPSHHETVHHWSDECWGDAAAAAQLCQDICCSLLLLHSSIFCCQKWIYLEELFENYIQYLTS